MDINDASSLMNGEVVARNYLTAQPTRIIWENGRIRAMEAAGDGATNLWFAPALFDPQINGFGGVDFQQETTTLADLTNATRALQGAGCGAYLVTLVTDDWERLISKLEHLVKLRAASRFLQKAIAGWHIEGPFLSAEPGFCGAHDPAKMCDPSSDKIDQIRRVTGNDPVLLTLAPEREGAIAAIAHAVRLGMRVSLGHTNASYEILLNAVRVGARAFTHLGNGCPQSLDRHDNVLWRMFDLARSAGTPSLTPTLIPDGIHVSPALFRLIHRHFGQDAVIHTTDAMAAAGMAPGKYRLGTLQVEVGKDQVVRMPGQTNYAGSALTPLQGVQRAARMLGCSWRDVWNRASILPAHLMSLDLGISVGRPARFCIIEEHDPNNIQLAKLVL